MAVLFGEAPNAEGWIKVTMISYQMESHENGHTINPDDIPEYPEGGMGVGCLEYYHPGNDDWKFEEIKVPYTDVESRLEIANAIRELAQAIKEK